MPTQRSWGRAAVASSAVAIATVNEAVVVIVDTVEAVLDHAATRSALPPEASEARRSALPSETGEASCRALPSEAREASETRKAGIAREAGETRKASETGKAASTGEARQPSRARESARTTRAAGAAACGKPTATRRGSDPSAPGGFGDLAYVPGAAGQRAKHCQSSQCRKQSGALHACAHSSSRRRRLHPGSTSRSPSSPGTHEPDADQGEHEQRQGSEYQGQHSNEYRRQRL